MYVLWFPYMGCHNYGRQSWNPKKTVMQYHAVYDMPCVSMSCHIMYTVYMYIETLFVIFTIGEIKSVF